MLREVRITFRNPFLCFKNRCWTSAAASFMNTQPAHRAGGRDRLALPDALGWHWVVSSSRSHFLPACVIPAARQIAFPTCSPLTALRSWCSRAGSGWDGGCCNSSCFRGHRSSGCVMSANSFVEMWFTYRIIHPFKGCNAVLFCIFTEMSPCYFKDNKILKCTWEVSEELSSGHTHALSKHAEEMTQNL